MTSRLAWSLAVLICLMLSTNSAVGAEDAESTIWKAVTLEDGSAAPGLQLQRAGKHVYAFEMDSEDAVIYLLEDGVAKEVKTADGSALKGNPFTAVPVGDQLIIAGPGNALQLVTGIKAEPLLKKNGNAVTIESSSVNKFRRRPEQHDGPYIMMSWGLCYVDGNQLLDAEQIDKKDSSGGYFMAGTYVHCTGRNKESSCWYWDKGKAKRIKGLERPDAGFTQIGDFLQSSAGPLYYFNGKKAQEVKIDTTGALNLGYRLDDSWLSFVSDGRGFHAFELHSGKASAWKPFKDMPPADYMGWSCGAHIVLAGTGGDSHVYKATLKDVQEIKLPEGVSFRPRPDPTTPPAAVGAGQCVALRVENAILQGYRNACLEHVVFPCGPSAVAFVCQFSRRCWKPEPDPCREPVRSRS